ncbi:MAG: HAD family phosphatase [Clostridia bacterium]|nr:HAD family phosphatase [Clostridia bacterium]
MTYKLIAVDLDDTLLRNDLTISDRAKRAIQAAMDKGTLVTFATGRMYRSALPYALALGLDLPLITYQGALVKYADGRQVYHRPIDLSIAREIINLGKQWGIHINVYINDELYMETETQWGKDYAAKVRVPVNLLDLPLGLNQNPTKILFLDEPEVLDMAAQKLAERFKDAINLTKSKNTYLEISHPKATKGNALKELAQSLQIRREEVMAIGDNLNDLDMINYAGCGVAVGNAVQALKEAADFITGTNDDDGVAEAIEKLVL